MLRREQVHKVVLNQLISLDFNLQPMSSSDKAWLWGGYNYAEDEMALEKLAARFKNTEMANTFFNAIQTILNTMQDEQKVKEIPTTVQNIGAEDVSDNEDEHVSEEEDEDEDEEDYEDDER